MEEAQWYVGLKEKIAWKCIWTMLVESMKDLNVKVWE